MDTHFIRSAANFEDGFNEFNRHEFTGRCMIRAGEQCIALETCATETSVGRELCREEYSGKTRDQIDKIVVKHVKKFLSIVGEHQHLNFAIAIMTTLKTRFTFKFHYNQNALIKYHWDNSCLLLHVEIPKNYTRSAEQHEAEFTFGTPATAGPSLRVLFEDKGPHTGRKIFAFNARQSQHQLPYFALHDDSASLLRLVSDRYQGTATELVRQNHETELAQERLPATIFNVEPKDDFERALRLLKHYGPVGHLVIYAEKKSISLECRHDRFTSQKMIYEQMRRFECFIDAAAFDNKWKVETILKLIWEKKFLNYTIVFGENPCGFSTILRYEHGSPFETQMRHQWDTPIGVNFLTVVHSGRSDDDSHMREIQVKIEHHPLDDSHMHGLTRITDCYTLDDESRLYKYGSEIYSTVRSPQSNPNFTDPRKVTAAILERRPAPRTHRRSTNSVPSSPNKKGSSPKKSSN